MPSRPRLERLRGQRGFTLIELLVVMVAAVVVSSALFTILDVTMRQTTRTLSRVDATQRARTAMETMEQELHSSCVANKVRPIMNGSTGSSVSFWNQYGNGVSLTPVKHTLSFSSSTAKLTDTIYPVASGTAPTWTASGTPTSTETLLTNVAQSGSTPVFQYFSVEYPANTSPLPTPLSVNNAEKTSEVRITLLVKPAGGSLENTNLVTNTVTNSVLLRLTPIANSDGTTQEFLPCA